MIHFVHRYPKFDKQLNVLRKSGKKGAIAAKKADKIIDKLMQGVPCFRIGILTKNGEFRLKNCIKYDLGNGYRLITVKENDHLFLLYIGTHDECHRWIENNRGCQPEITKTRTRTFLIKKNRANFHLRQHSEREPDETEADFFKPVEEKHLRAIFSGLCGE
ncbi:toxin-antitoxin domain-containing protein [Desulfonema magnum]|uniref:Toxin-antitoxin domain-containing protein n=1 Tax=Desulfonema magnum TaxID=45655 RepID=A0A975BJS3_9BACT|nr:toxin-antitoxin domain-containing protein [Desulfonema magnum]